MISQRTEQEKDERETGGVSSIGYCWRIRRGDALRYDRSAG